MFYCMQGWFWGFYFMLLLLCHEAVASPCSPRLWPAQFGGAADAVVNKIEAQKWHNYKQQRYEEALAEAKSPKLLHARYKLEYHDIEAGCVSPNQLIDLGRAIFLRRFSREEGYGHKLPNHPPRSRFQRGHFGGPDASACVDCHWKGGFAGSGDRVDNTYAFGDGNTLSTAEPRNPPALWGLGWVQIIAEEMSSELQSLKEEASQKVRTTQKSLRVELLSKGISFGFITVQPQGLIDYSELEGVDQDLVIKPFGWRGVFSSLREFVEISAHKHLGLQSERLIHAPYAEIELGNGPKNDPDQDGILQELSEGQITALVVFLATLDSPQIEIPTHGLYQYPPKFGPLEFIDTPAFADRWQKGALLFEQVGCAHCHRPLLPVSQSVFKSAWFDVNPIKHPPQKHKNLNYLPTPETIRPKGHYQLDLSQWAAHPHPESKVTIDQGQKQVQWLVPVFSDFKRHRMGDALKGLYSERGVPSDTYITRRLWGLRKTSPYLHHGGAITFEEAIKAHDGDGSEAEEAAEYYFSLNEDEKSSVRLFLSSLSRGPAIRIR